METVLIDIDDTISDLLSAWLKTLNEKYGTSVYRDDVTDWDMRTFYPSLTREQIFEPLHHNGFWKTVKPKPDAMEYVEKLFNEGYNVFLCTSTDYRNIRAKYEYIVKRYFPYIEWNHVIIASNKQMIQADYLIDDGIHNLENGNFIKILMTAPHNRNYDAKANGMYRADNWKEVYDFIHKVGKTLRNGGVHDR